MRDPNPHPLNYATPNPKEGWLGYLGIVLLMIGWPFIIIGLRATALLLPILAIFGIINYFHPIHELSKLEGRWTLLYICLSIILIPLIVWHWRWYRRHNAKSRKCDN